MFLIILSTISLKTLVKKLRTLKSKEVVVKLLLYKPFGILNSHD